MTLDDDDFPTTHLEDDDYDDFLAREFDHEGRPRGELPVTRILIAIVVALVVLAVYLLR